MKRPMPFTEWDEKELARTAVQALEACWHDLVQCTRDSGERRIAVGDLLDCASNQLHTPLLSEYGIHSAEELPVMRDHELQYRTESAMRKPRHVAKDVLRTFQEYDSPHHRWATHVVTEAIKAQFGASRGWVRL